MRALGRAASFLSRAAVWCAVVYVACLPLARPLLRAMTLAAGGVLWLVDRPAILTSLSSRGERVVVATYLSGFEQPLVTWEGGNLPVFLVATLGLSLAAPASDGWRRLETGLLAALASLVVMVATVAIQLRVVADNQARATLGLVLHDERGYALLAAANQGIGVAMLLLPAAMFALAYLRFRTERGTAERRRGRGTVAALAGAFALVTLGLGVLATLGASPVDPRPGLVRVVELNPGVSRAHLALAFHDALRGPARPSRAGPSRRPRHR